MDSIDLFLLIYSIIANLLVEVLMIYGMFITDDVEIIRMCALIIFIFIPNLIYLVRRAINE